MRIQYLRAFLPAVDIQRWGQDFYNHVILHPEVSAPKYVEFLQRIIGDQDLSTHYEIPVPESFTKAHFWRYIKGQCKVVKEPTIQEKIVADSVDF